MKITFLKIMASCFLTIAFTPSLHAQPTTQTETLEELKLELEKIRTETGTAAIGIAIVTQNGSVWAAGLGEANVEKHVQADANSLFRIGSASKIFVGLSILKLVEEGKLLLDDKLHDIAPEIPFDNPWETTHPIRIAHLLEHTTGWDIITAEYANDAPDSMSLQEGLSDPARIKARKSRWIPGTRHAYSNSGPVVAAYIVEKITHQKYEDFVQEKFFNPLQMNSSTFYKTSHYLQHAATPYVDNKPQEYAQMYSRPSSSLNSSPNDMAQLLLFFIQRGKINNHSVLSPTSIHSMQTPRTTLGAAQGIKSGYGLTLQIFGNDNPNIALYGHTGGLPGAITDFAFIPKLNAGYVLMLNSSNGEAAGRIQQLIRKHLLKGVVTKPPTQAIELPTEFRKLTGFYRQINPSGSIEQIQSDILGIMKFSVNDNRLHREPFFGGWKSSDYATNIKTLTNPYTGLPSVAIVQDPLVGDAVQVDSALYKKVSAISVYGRLIFLMSLILGSATSILFMLIWIPRLILGKLKMDKSIHLRCSVLGTSLTLVLLPLAPMIFGSGVLEISRFSPTSVSLFLLSIIYPLLACYSIFVVYKNRTITMNRWLYWHSALLAMLHMAFAIYIATYGLIGLRLWA